MKVYIKLKNIQVLEALFAGNVYGYKICYMIMEDVEKKLMWSAILIYTSAIFIPQKTGIQYL